MKKLLILILVLTFMLSLASCKGGNDNNGDNAGQNDEQQHTVHTDEDGNGICDGCQAIFIDYDKPSTVGNILKNSLEKQIKETNSFKIDLELCATNENNSWYYDEEWDNETDSWVKSDIPRHSNYYTESVIKMEITASVVENGVNARIIAKTGQRSNTDDEIEFGDEQILYFIDGYVYTRKNGNYYTMESVVPEEIYEILEKLSTSEFISKEEKDDLLTTLGVEIATVFNIKDNKGSFSIDLKPGVDKLKSYITELDMEKDTVGVVIDDILQQISADLTSEKILAELERLADLTVIEALNELDVWLMRNHSTTIQGIYNSIAKDPEIISVIEMIIAESQGLDLTNADDKAELDKIIEDIQAFDIRKYIEDEGYGKETVYATISPLLPTKPADPEDPESDYVAISKEEIFESVRSLLKMTLGELEENFGIDVISQAKMIASAITINKLNAKVDLNFEGALMLKSVEGVAEFDVETNIDSEVEGKKNFTRNAFSIKFTISEISTEEKEISLPKGITILKNEYTVDNGEVDIWFRFYSDGGSFANINLTFTDPESGDNIEIYTHDISIDQLLSGKYSTHDYNIYINGSYYYNDMGVFTFIIDNEAGEFIVIKLPEYETIE